MFSNLDPTFWKKQQSNFHTAITYRAKRLDFECNFRSSLLQCQLIWTKDILRYLKIRCPIHLARLIAQLRLANIYNRRIICLKYCLHLSANATCKLCNTKCETVDHILAYCPALADLRQRHFIKIIETYLIYLNSHVILNIYE